MGHKHGRFFKRFQDAFQVIATIGTPMLIKAPMETRVRVIIRFKYVFALLPVAVFLFPFVGLVDVSLNCSEPF